MAMGPWQIIIIVLLVVLFFGRGRISEMMGDLAKGITSFKKGLRDEENGGQSASAAPTETPRISSQPAPSAENAAEPAHEDRSAS